MSLSDKSICIDEGILDYQTYYKFKDVKEAIRQIKIAGFIDLQFDRLVIQWSTFKEIFGKDLMEEQK